MVQGRETGECRNVEGRADCATDVLSVYEKIDKLVEGAAPWHMCPGVGLAAKDGDEFLGRVTLRLELRGSRIPTFEVAKIFDHAEQEISPSQGGAHR